MSAETEGWGWCDWIWELWQHHVQESSGSVGAGWSEMGRLWWRVAVVKLGLNNGSSDSGRCFGIEVWTDTAKLTNMVIARFGDMRSGQQKWGVSQIWSRGFEQSEWWWVRSWFWQVVYWDQWAVLEEFSVRFAVTQDEIWSRTLWRWSMLESKWVGRKEKRAESSV